VPAAAVIPAPIAYFSIAVVKKFVVGFQGRKLEESGSGGKSVRCVSRSSSHTHIWIGEAA